MRRSKITKVILATFLLLAAFFVSNSQTRKSPQLVVNNGHSGQVKSVAFSPDGKILASGSEDRTIKLWDVASRRFLKTLKFDWSKNVDELAHSRAITSVAFSADGKMLAAGSLDGTTSIWNVASGGYKTTLVEPHLWPEDSLSVNSVAFSPDGNTLAIGRFKNGVGEIKLWKLESEYFPDTGEYFFFGTILKTFKHSKSVKSVAFSPDGNTLASGSDDGTIKLWDVKIGAELRTIKHSKPDGILKPQVFSLVFSPDGETLASGSDDGTIKLWDVQIGTELRTLGKVGFLPTANSVAFSPDGKTLASGQRYNIKIWDVASGSELRTFGKDGFLWGTANSVAFSPDGKTIVSGMSDNTISIWKVLSGKELWKVKGNFPSVASLVIALPTGMIFTGDASKSDNKIIKLRDVIAFGRDGKTLAAGSDDSTIKLWNLAPATKLKTLKQSGEVYCLVFSPDGKTLASGSSDGTIDLWDVASGTELRTLPAHSKPERFSVFSLVFSPDSKILASGIVDGTIKLWDVASGTDLGILPAHSKIVYSVAFHPDGKVLASGSLDGTIKLWDVASGTKLRTLAGHFPFNSVAFSRDGKTLASGQRFNIKTWDVASGELLKTYADPYFSTLFEFDRLFPELLGFVSDELMAEKAENIKIKLFNIEKTKKYVRGFDDEDREIDENREEITLVAFDENNWLVTTPDGFFDSSIGADKLILWRFTQDLSDVASVESFYYEFYYPGLLKKIMAGERPQLPPAVVPFEEKDIRQADVRICRKCPCSQKSQFSVATQESERPETEICIDILASPDFVLTDFINFNALARRLIEGKNIISQEVFDTFLPDSRKAIREYAVSSGKDQTKKPGYELLQMMRREMGAFLRQDDFYDRYEGFVENISSETKSLKLSSPKGNEIAWLNRMLLEDAFPESIKRGKISNLESIRGQTAESERNRRTKCPENEVCLQDMRLFWNNRLMQRWRGDMTKNCSTASRYRIQCKTKVPVVSGTENHYSAYLFNQDRVKSKDGALVFK